LCVFDRQRRRDTAGRGLRVPAMRHGSRRRRCFLNNTAKRPTPLSSSPQNSSFGFARVGPTFLSGTYAGQECPAYHDDEIMKNFAKGFRWLLLTRYRSARETGRVVAEMEGRDIWFAWVASIAKIGATPILSPPRAHVYHHRLITHFAFS